MRQIIRTLHHVGFTVADLERSIAFYELLGFEMVFRWNPRADYLATLVGYPDVDMHAAVMRIPGDEMSLELLDYRGVQRQPVQAANGDPGHAHVALRVEGLDQLWADLQASGVPSVSEPVTPTIGPNRGGRAIYLIDPDGFRVELIETAASFTEYAADFGVRNGEDASGNANSPTAELTDGEGT